MIVAIITKEKALQSANDGMVYFMREMINWNEDITNKQYTSIICEYGVILEDVEIIDTELSEYDTKGNITKEVTKTVQIIKKVENRRRKAFKISYQQSAQLFNMIGQDILHTEDLPEKHNQMKALALKIDTEQYLAKNDGSFFGLQPGAFEIYIPKD